MRLIKCLGCGETVEDRSDSKTRLRCSHCKVQAGILRAKEKYRKASKTYGKPVECKMCGKMAERTGRNQYLCKPCAKESASNTWRERRKDPEYKKRESENASKRHAERYANDPAYRDKYLRDRRLYRKVKYATNPEFREKRKSEARVSKARARSSMATFLRWRDGDDCSWCGDALPETNRWVEIDHRLAIHNWPDYMPSGSVHAVSNLQLLHSKCNTRKHARIQVRDMRMVA